MKALGLLLTLSLTQVVWAEIDRPLHLDLEMTTKEYQAIYLNQRSNLRRAQHKDTGIERAIQLGERLSKWIDVVNAERTPETAIRLTSASTRVGVPIERPNVYNPTIITAKTDEILRDLPAAMKTVILATTELPHTIPLDDETFIKHARLLNKNYQQAVRYNLVDSNRMYYTMAAKKDVRGYYYLVTNKIGAYELRDVALIPANKVAPIKEALTKICINAGISGCPTVVDNSFKDNTLAKLYETYIGHAQANWEAFFVIPTSARRRDINWMGNTATVPFNTPSLPKFIPYLQNNIEDEYRWGNWGLKMHFGSYSSGPRLVFQPNVVPHVNGLGGNEIVMDSNQPIEEYESQWTIRHEFGHVLGLPDCYHEFYDTNLRAYVNYQLDITDLMCSRAGNMKERIYLELKKAYSKK